MSSSFTEKHDRSFQHAARTLFRGADLLAPRLAGRRGRNLWFTVPPPWRGTAATRRRAVHRHLAGRGGPRPRVGRGPGRLPGPRLGRPRQPARGFVEPLVAAGLPRRAVRRTRTRRLDPGPPGPGVPTASSSARRSTPCSPGSAPRTPSSRTRSAPSRRTSRCATAGSAPNAWCCSRRWSRPSHSVDQFQARPRLRRPHPPRLRPRRSTPSSASRSRSSTPGSRPRTPTRCRRSSCTTAATGRRRTPTPSAWSTGCRTPTGHHRRARPPPDPAGPGRPARRGGVHRRPRRPRGRGAEA